MSAFAIGDVVQEIEAGAVKGYRVVMDVSADGVTLAYRKSLLAATPRLKVRGTLPAGSLRATGERMSLPTAAAPKAAAKVAPKAKRAVSTRTACGAPKASGGECKSTILGADGRCRVHSGNVTDVREPAKPADTNALVIGEVVALLTAAAALLSKLQ